ncbi:MAG: hisE [Xanthobacteraceae bacterium]|jgi:phosphoribosyl-ATP pyrophosphohydrolase|nr:hisE [Xanthobacteraceae bacterium]
MTDSIRRLYDGVVATREGRNPSPRTERLFGKGRSFIAKKVAEEGVEVALEAVVADSSAVIRESADLIYNLVVLWADAGVSPEDIWAEMARREQLMGIAEKLPKRGAKPIDGRQFALSLVANVGEQQPDPSAAGAAIMVKRRKRV